MSIKRFLQTLSGGFALQCGALALIANHKEGRHFMFYEMIGCTIAAVIFFLIPTIFPPKER